MVFKKSKWIWAKNSFSKDDYAEFVFNVCPSSNRIKLRISSDSIYAIYINNKLSFFMECSDFPNDKFYDEYEINVKPNKNISFKIDVWHYGESSQKYIESDHGLIFEILDNDEIICPSSKNIKSRVISEFKNGLQKLITSQQGFSFEYKFTSDANFIFEDSIEVIKECKYSKRNINNIVLLKRIKPTYKSLAENDILIDLGEEVSGLPDIDIISSKNQKVVVSFGEHIENNHVTQIISNRDFSYSYNLIKGRNTNLNPLKRVGARYLEIKSEAPIKIKYCGLRPVNYDHKIIKQNFNDQVINKIYEMCVHTLECCMHEHYEDCPWREQCLYALDSRNQMLCGYYAFEGFEYQKHNLVLLSKALNKDGLLSICTPSGIDHPIPSFSLYYFLAVKEYLDYSNDLSIIPEIKETLEKLMNTFLSKVDENGLIKHFDSPYWNFYEWAPFSSYDNEIPCDRKNIKKQYDLILNCLFVLAVNCYNKILNKSIDVKTTINSIKSTFFDENKHVFMLDDVSKNYSQFGNSLAVLVGLGDDRLIKNILNDENMIRCTLSTRGFFYDALLEKTGYEEFVINDIKSIYSKMLSEGSSTVWETELGYKDFDGAGSLCHGWSAIPIYYFNKILKK